MAASYLFEDVFEVQEENPDGKFFDKGVQAHRSVCSSLFASCWYHNPGAYTTNSGLKALVKSDGA